MPAKRIKLTRCGVILVFLKQNEVHKLKDSLTFIDPIR